MNFDFLCFISLQIQILRNDKKNYFSHRRQRSGKSGYAQRLALELSDCPVYMATSRVWDEEYRKRIERHQRDRGPQWTNIEEEKALSKHHLQGR